MKVYRISKKEHANLEGLGGLYGPGRWNEKGHRVIYVSDSISLAAWEKFVYISNFQDLPDDLVVLTIHIPEDILIKEVPKKVLIPGWNISTPFNPYKEETQNFGTAFLVEKKQLVLKIPSAIIKGEYNYLLNPNHQDIKKCTIEKIDPFNYDKRIAFK